MDELRDEVLKFTRDRDWDQFHSPENLAKSISIEAGELLECFQWGSEYNQEAVEMELADVLNYCIQLADKLGVSIEEIVRKKLKISEEKYPIEKSKGNSKKYTDFCVQLHDNITRLSNGEIETRNLPPVQLHDNITRLSNTPVALISALAVQLHDNITRLSNNNEQLFILGQVQLHDNITRLSNYHPTSARRKTVQLHDNITRLSNW